MVGNSIRVVKLSEQEGKDFLRGIISTGNCIPLIGAGFTAGERAFAGVVPSGAQFMKTMREAINNSPVKFKPPSSSLEKYGFQQLADEYFRASIVDLNDIKTDLRNRFTNVKISSEAKKSFLHWGWDYIYTLNIDDAIEKELKAIKVLPFSEFSQHQSSQFVYKLHGDAGDAVAAKDAVSMKLIFGNADYIKSLIKNRSLISTLINDLTEKHLLFVGCSLTDEVDILYALANLDESALNSSNRRVYVTSVDVSEDYESMRKMERYGITDLLIVDYADFYSFVGDIDSLPALKKSVLEPYFYAGNLPRVAEVDKDFLKYLLQIDWSLGRNPTQYTVDRCSTADVVDIIREPVVVIWGRRFSGKTAFLYEILEKFRDRRRYFIPSSVASADNILNALMKAKDSLIAVDAGVLTYRQMQLLVDKADRIMENNSTIILATSRGWLSALGALVVDSSFEVIEKMNYVETAGINQKLEKFGLSKNWKASDQHLQNIFSLSESPVVAKMFNEQSRLQVNINRLHEQWSNSSVGKLEFCTLFYLSTRQRIFSRYFGELANYYDLKHLAVNHFSDFAKRWEPFIEFEDADSNSRRTERSVKVVVANSSAWIHHAIRVISDKLGVEQTADLIVDTYKVMEGIEDKAFELLLFDNLNAIFSDSFSDMRAAVILAIYEKLSTNLGGSPDYWLQRAKAFYYISSKVSELSVAVEYCEKSIVKKGGKTSINAKLTKANLLGKICKVKKSPEDEDIIEAIDAYIEAIDSRSDNPIYIDELLRKSKNGKSYMMRVCEMAHRRPSLLEHKINVNTIKSYVTGKF